ncbi:MAG: acyltransferase [Oscillospiraceae bacterium]|nr:acyltransferase [Oscillospiraceae bacterium]
MATPKSKIGFIAAARCIGILLVVFGHSFPFDVYIPPMLWKTNDFIYKFHMPLFIFISGWLLMGNTRSAGVYIRRRGIRLLIPYFVLSIAAFLPKILIQQFLNDSVEFSLWHLIETELVPRANVWGHFWYIPVIFILGCVGVLLQKLLKKHHEACGFILAAAYLLLFVPQTTDWFALEDLRKNAFYFILGMTASNWSSSASALTSRLWLLAFPGAFVLFRMADGVLSDSLIACLMIGFVLHIGTRLKTDSFRLLSAIEQNSFTVYLLSWPAQAVVEVVCNRILHLPALLTMVMMFTAGVCVPLVCVKIVSILEKHIPMKWVKLVIGM